jgi:hypothetical protein
MADEQVAGFLARFEPEIAARRLVRARAGPRAAALAVAQPGPEETHGGHGDAASSADR